MQLRAQRWFTERTFAAAQFPLNRLLAAKAATRISVVLPARDEAATIGAIVRAIAEDLQAPGLVDEILVVDSHSRDDTATVAAAAGARVVTQQSVLPELGDRPGKGEAMWKALAAVDGDVVVFLDADLEEFDPTYVLGLVGPLLLDPAICFVKGMYERPLRAGATVHPAGGGRVTELVARPLLDLHWPELAGVVQPLAGEYAARRTVLERVPFVGGYGVDLGLLIDLLHLVGLEGLAQVDLGSRLHRHQSDEALGRMALQIQLTVLGRLEGATDAADRSVELVRFRRTAAGFAAVEEQVELSERPPMRTLVDRRARAAVRDSA